MIEAGEITTRPQEMTMETQTATQMARQRPKRSMNGMDLDKMTQTVTALKGDPMLAQFQFRARNQWIDGGENRSTIRDFYGAGAEDASRTKPFVFTNGEPPVLLGNNEGANPVEFLLHALGA